jgi:hypothetical protein
MTTFILIAVPVWCFVTMVAWACCIAAGRADDRLEEMRREDDVD